MAEKQGFYYQLRDSTGERASFSFTGEEVTALNIAGVLANGQAFETAVEAVTLGQWTRKQATIFDNTYNPAINTAAENQKEKCWKVNYHGATTGKPFHIHIPTADLSLLPIVDGKRSEYLNLAADEGLALKEAFEDVARSPDDDEENVIVDSVQYVGRP